MKKEILNELNWIYSQVETKPFSEIGVTFIIHNNCITKIKRQISEKIKTSNNQ